MHVDAQAGECQERGQRSCNCKARSCGAGACGCIHCSGAPGSSMPMKSSCSVCRAGNGASCTQQLRTWRCSPCKLLASCSIGQAQRQIELGQRQGADLASRQGRAAKQLGHADGDMQLAQACTSCKRVADILRVVIVAATAQQGQCSRASRSSANRMYTRHARFTGQASSSVRKLSAVRWRRRNMPHEPAVLAAHKRIAPCSGALRRRLRNASSSTLQGTDSCCRLLSALKSSSGVPASGYNLFRRSAVSVAGSLCTLLLCT